MAVDPASVIYKIIDAALWTRAQREEFVPPMAVDEADGFIHFSTLAQLTGTLRLHFAGRSDIMLLAVRAQDLADGLRWEPSRGDDLFPHLYGALPVSAVLWAKPVTVSADGDPHLPDMT